MAVNQDNVSELSDIFTHGLLIQWASIIKYPTKHVDIVAKRTSSSSNVTCSRHDIDEHLFIWR